MKNTCPAPSQKHIQIYKAEALECQTHKTSTNTNKAVRWAWRLCYHATLACNPCQVQPCKSSALHKIGRRRARRILQMHTKLNCPLDRPAPFAIVSTSGHRMQQNNKMRTRIFRVSSLSRSRKQDTNNDQVHGSASPANQLFSFLHNSSSYSQFSKSQGPVNIQKLQGPFSFAVQMTTLPF